MVNAIAVLKKLAELFASSKKGRSFIGYAMGIIIFLLLLPVIVLYGLFGWLSGSDSLPDLQVDSAIIERAIEAIDTTENSE